MKIQTKLNLNDTLFLVCVKDSWIVVIRCKIYGLVIKKDCNKFLVTDFKVIRDSKGQVISIFKDMTKEIFEFCIDDKNATSAQFIFPYGLCPWKVFSSKENAKKYIVDCKRKNRK